MRILPSISAAIIAATVALAGAADPRTAFSQLPAWFEPAPSGASFQSRSASLSLTVDTSGATFAHLSDSVRLSFPGSRPAAALLGLDPQSAFTQYFVGANPSAWRRNVPHFQRVAAQAVYPGIDVVYYSAGKILEYDFVVQPGACPGDIRLRFSGPTPALQPDGSLLLAGGLRQHAPVAYQQRDGVRVPISSRYQIAGQEVRFALGHYDPSLPLVIDPVLTWAGYFGGDQAEAILAAAAAPDGSYWIAGSSRSVIPIPPNTDPFSWTRNGVISSTTLTTAITASGTSFTVAYISGFPITAPFNITIDDETLTVVEGAGTTSWTVVRGVEGTVPAIHLKDALVRNYQPDVTTKDAFLARIAPDGATWKLAYFSYIGGGADDEATGIAISGSRIALAGNTASSDFPLSSNAFQKEKDAEFDAFVLLYDPQASGADCLTFSSYFGGEKSDTAQSIAVGPDGRLAVAGYTSSGFLRNVNSGQSLQPANRGGVEAFLVVAQPIRTFPESFLYATYFGGSSTDIASAVAFDPAGKVLIAGTTMSDDLPVSDNVQYPYPRSVGDGFIARIDPELTVFDSFLYGGYFGGSDLDSIQAMTVDSQNRVWVTGYTFSDDMPISPGAYAISRSGSVDAFVARLDLTKSGAAFVDFCTYFGGRSGDVPYAIALHPASGTATIAGYTSSSDLPFKDVQGTPLPPIRITEIFAARFDPAKTAQNQLVWSVILGGPGSDVASAMALDTAGTAFIAGYSNSANLNTGNAPPKPSPPGAVSGVFFRIAQ
jgi:hypothetical protein